MCGVHYSIGVLGVGRRLLFTQKEPYSIKDFLCTETLNIKGPS